MKITAIEAIPFAIPYVKPLKLHRVKSIPPTTCWSVCIPTTVWWG